MMIMMIMIIIINDDDTTLAAAVCVRDFQNFNRQLFSDSSFTPAWSVMVVTMIMMMIMMIMMVVVVMIMIMVIMIMVVMVIMMVMIMLTAFLLQFFHPSLVSVLKVYLGQCWFCFGHFYFVLLVNIWFNFGFLFCTNFNQESRKILVWKQFGFYLSIFKSLNL